MRAALFRADATATLGSGHVMRCLSFAEALADEGWVVAFACRSGSLSCAPALADAPYRVIELDGADDGQAIRSAFPAGVDMLVVDHYGLDERFESSLRGWAKRICVIDDLAERRHDADLLLDQNRRTTFAGYTDLIPAECLLALGPDYALLRPAFAKSRLKSLRRRRKCRPIRRILLQSGMSDPTCLLPVLANAAHEAFPSASLTVLAGQSAASLPELLSMQPVPKLALQADSDQIAAHLEESDVMIGAAGSTCWEAACLGVPMLLVQTADNQSALINLLAETGAAGFLGQRHRLDGERLAQCLSVFSQEQAFASSQAAAGLCDGLGAYRLCQLADPERTSDGLRVRLRRVTQQDEMLICNWQQQPSCRRYARNPEPPSFDEHQAWFRQRVNSQAGPYAVIEADGRPSGAIRLDACQPKGGGEDSYEVSIFLDPEFFGQGLGTAALRSVRRLLPFARLNAHIKAENTASVRAFSKAGFSYCGEEQYSAAPLADGLIS